MFKMIATGVGTCIKTAGFLAMFQSDAAAIHHGFLINMFLQDFPYLAPDTRLRSGLLGGDRSAVIC